MFERETYMKNKKLLPILLILSAFTISGCGSSKPSSSPISSSEEPSTSEPSSSSSEESKPSSSSSSAKPSSSSSSAKPSSSSSQPSSSSAQPSSSSSSSSSSSRPESQYFVKDITVKLDPGIKKAEEGQTLEPYNLSFTFDDELFLGNPKKYNNDLSMLSLGASLATMNKTKGTAFFTEAEFEDIASHDYDGDPTKDTMAYFMAHKTIGNYELVTVSFRGFDYGLEWANNFTIGKTGDHEGFAARGAETYEALKTYLNTYAKDKSLKVWINGYSRAGALSNMLASLILRNNELAITQDNLFVYTFEAPASLTDEHAIAYPNVHNIINDADLITFIPPAQYELYRCGKDYQIYDPNVATLMNQFDEGMNFPEFEEIDENTTNDAQYRDFLLKSIFEHEITDEEDEKSYADNREQYVNNYQAGLSNAIGYIFALSDNTRSQLLANLKGLGMGAIFIIGDETGAKMAEFIKPYLDKDNVPYTEEGLLSDCAVLVKGIRNLFFTVLLSLAADGASSNDLGRLLDMHYPETTYVLLQNAHAKAEADPK